MIYNRAEVNRILADSRMSKKVHSRMTYASAVSEIYAIAYCSDISRYAQKSIIRSVITCVVSSIVNSTVKSRVSSSVNTNKRNKEIKK